MVDTPIYARLKHKVKVDEKNEHSLNDHQAKLLQQQANNKATIKASQDSIDIINKDLNYTWKKVKTKHKVGKRTYTKTKKVWTKREKPANPTRDQQAQLDRYNAELKKSREAVAKLDKSGQYKQAKRQRQKLKAQTKHDKRNLAKYEAKRRKKAKADISKKVKAQESDFLAPKATMFETDGTSNAVVFIFATSETEDNESTITSYPVDHDENVTDHVQNSDKTLAIEGRLMGHTAGANVSASRLYNQLLDWRFKGTELTYKSNGSKQSENLNIAHNYNKHFHIQSLQKTQDQALVDEVKFSMTLKFVYRPQVTTTKSKVNNKGKKVTLGKCIAPKVIKGKPGKTMYDYAKKYHTTVKNLISMNKDKKYTATTNLNGKKLQVDMGGFYLKTAKVQPKIHRQLTPKDIAIAQKQVQQLEEVNLNGN